jgi:transcriptional regulator
MNQEVLAVFNGPHSYISSSWYETNMSVPTWNYVALHAYGNIELLDERNEVLKSLNDLVKKYEEPNSPYSIDDTNNEFIAGLMNGIVGFRFNINRLEGKWKLSQNHSKDRQERVIKELEKSKNDNAKEIARLMKENFNSF